MTAGLGEQCGSGGGGGGGSSGARRAYVTHGRAGRRLQALRGHTRIHKVAMVAVMTLS